MLYYLLACFAYCFAYCFAVLPSVRRAQEGSSSTSNLLLVRSKDAISVPSRMFLLEQAEKHEQDQKIDNQNRDH